MGLSSAMYTGLSGLSANQTRIDTIGHNIANVNTTAFKGSRTLFQTQFYETLQAGTAPSDELGGVNPMQVGHGVIVGTTQQMFGDGPIETTGLVGDLAIEGDGFFILQTAENDTRFTRDGAFSLDAINQLVSADGYRVQGYGVDDAYNINPTTIQDIVVPLGSTTVAHATENVSLDGDLSAEGAVSAQSSQTSSQALVAGGGAAATDTTALTDLRSADAPDTLLFVDGDTITLSGVAKGDRELPAETFVVGTDGTTLGDYATWLQNVLGVQDIAGVPGDPGVLVENGALVVRSNAGTQNSITIANNDMTSTNATTPLPFQFTQDAAANGSSLFTGFTVYDSLGTPVSVQVTFALEDKPNLGPVWRFFVESPEASGETRALSTGTVAFDTNGNVREVIGNQITLDLDQTGAATPLSFAIDFNGIHGLSTATSNVILNEQDGYPPGTLSGYSVDKTGVVSGTFSNGLSRTLGQVALAVFPNAEGLVAERENLFSAGPNGGALAITVPGQFGAGWVRSGALEMSNVDLGQEFIGLVNASTGFQASSRVISVSSDLLNQLLLLIR